jgi:hypothetical protein
MPLPSTVFRSLILAWIVSGIGVAHGAQPAAAPPRPAQPAAPAPSQPGTPPAGQPVTPPAGQPAPPAEQPATPPAGQPASPAEQPAAQPTPPAAQPPAQPTPPAAQPGAPAAITGTLRGRVIDTATGEPLAGAFVSAGDQTDLSGPDGRFTLTGIALGKVEVMAVADLYTPQILALDLTPALPVADVELTLAIDTAVAGEVVEIVGEAPDPAEPPSYDLGVAEIRVLPGAGNDTLKALQSLPGVARMPFGLGGLVLRGASPNDTNVYLDGVDVPLLYHFGGLASFYPSSMLTSVEMVPGNFSVEYGRSQGGVVLVRSRPGRTDRWRVQSEVSLQDASVSGDGPAPFGGAWTVGLRRSYIDAVLGLVLPEDGGFALTVAPRYYDGQLRYDLEVGPDQRLTAMVFASDDRLSFLFEDADEDNPAEMTQSNFNFVQRFARVVLRWERRTPDVTLSATPWMGWDENSIRFDEEGVSKEPMPFGMGVKMLRSFDHGYLAGGIDLVGTRLDSFYNGQPPPQPGQEMPGDDEPTLRQGIDWHVNAGFWLEGLYGFLDDGVNVKPGLRIEHYGLSEEWVVDPRLNVAVPLSSGVTLKPATGLFHQQPTQANMTPGFGNPGLHSSYALQNSVGVEWKSSMGFEVTATGFYNQLYDQSVDVVTGATGAGAPGTALSGGGGAALGEGSIEHFGTGTYQENVGRGRNYGIETLLRGSGGTPDRRGSWLGWIAYTLSRSLRRQAPGMDGPPPYLPYVLDQPHVLTALGSILVTDNWRVGARVQFVSGNPITPLTGSYYDAEEQQYRPMAGDLLSERLPAFFQLDLRVDRMWRRPWGTVSLFLDVRNVTNRRNVEDTSYNYDYTEKAYTTGLPIFPSIGLSYQP